MRSEEREGNNIQGRVLILHLSFLFRIPVIVILRLWIWNLVCLIHILILTNNSTSNNLINSLFFLPSPLDSNREFCPITTNTDIKIKVGPQEGDRGITEERTLKIFPSPGYSHI